MEAYNLPESYNAVIYTIPTFRAPCTCLEPTIHLTYALLVNRIYLGQAHSCHGDHEILRGLDMNIEVTQDHQPGEIQHHV